MHSVDVVVSFETIEHHDQHLEMIQEIRRVLRQDGVLIISSPDKHEYSDVPGYRNEYHIKELYLSELNDLLASAFRHVRIFGQRVYFGSLVAPIDGRATRFASYSRRNENVRREPGVMKPVYYIALASNAVLPEIHSGLYDGTAFLGSELGGRDGHIASLAQGVAERDGQIAGLNQAVVERDGQIANLNQAVVERDGQIANLNQAVVERDGQIASLNEAVVERDGQIASLNEAVVERDGQIASLNEAVVERDGQIASLNEAVVERDGQIASLNEAVVERDGQIASLNQAVVERDGQIASLNQAVVERDGQIASVRSEANRVAQEKDREIQDVRLLLAQVLQSRSWRAMAPLRSLVRSIRRGVELIRSDPRTSSLRKIAGPLRVRRNLRLSSQLKQVRESSLFDAEYYLASNPDVRSAEADPAKHYLLCGWKEGRDPSAAFSTSQYLLDYPDVDRAGVNPLVHYLRHGHREARLISPSEHASQGTSSQAPASLSNASALPKISQAAIDAEVEAIRKSGLFDESYYRSMYADLQLGLQDPIRHYCEHGWRQGKNPSDDFDTRFYLETYSDIRNAGINPFFHYVVAGASELKQVRESSLFDAEYYLASNPDVRSAEADPAKHYLLHGWKEGRDPSAAFSTSQYLLDYPDVDRAGVNPLVHYLRHGHREARLISPSKYAPRGTSSLAPASLSNGSAPPKISQAAIDAEVKAIRKSGLLDESVLPLDVRRICSLHRRTRSDTTASTVGAKEKIPRTTSTRVSIWKLTVTFAMQGLIPFTTTSLRVRRKADRPSDAPATRMTFSLGP